MLSLVPDGVAVNAADPRQRGRGATQCGVERVQLGGMTLALDGYALAVVADEAAELQPSGQTVDERPKANTLHLTSDDPAPAGRGRHDVEW